MVFHLLTFIVPNTRSPTFVTETLLKFESHMDPCTSIVGDFSTPLSPMNRSSRKKLNREILLLTDIMNKMDLTDIYRIFHPNTKQCTFFSAPQELSPKLTTYSVMKQV